MSEANSAITDLQSRWHTLHDLDRAKAIRSVIRSEHISQRKLAAALNCSESLLTPSIARRSSKTGRPGTRSRWLNLYQGAEKEIAGNNDSSHENAP